MAARELSKFELKILLLDKENDVSCGASKANSGIIHGGYDAKHGTLKSRLVRKGNRSFKNLEKELNFGYRECGSMVLAFNEEQKNILETLRLNGTANGVNDLQIIDKNEILEREPSVNPAVMSALFCPSAGVASPYELVIALAENALQNGVKISLNDEVKSIASGKNRFLIQTVKNNYTSEYVINCAGVYSDHVAAMVSADDFGIIPRRGEYILLNRDEGEKINSVLFQCPTNEGKGILVTKTFHGNLMLGPNAQEISNKEDTSTNLEVLENIVKTARNTLPGFDIRKTLRSFSGLRATSDRHDFIIEESPVKKFINAAGIESPGLTSSPAIAQYIISILRDCGLQLKVKSDFNPFRKGIIIKKDESFSGDINSVNPDEKIICRCETVTETEIIDSLKRGIYINSLDQVKRRTRAGMGLCQGKFCGPRVAEIISRENGISLNEVSPRGKGSSSLPHREDRLFWKKLEEN
ncbi:MAG: FAD-dependent oxidoreductase [Spirochaetes bacterium]|nr:FAD-dependent oxidoreductase [Spirochaetota bacterium]